MPMSSRRSGILGGLGKGDTGPRRQTDRGSGCDIPTEVSEFLVDALESHDCVYVWLWMACVRVGRAVGQRVWMCGVEELKWDVCSQQGQRLALNPKESKCGVVSGQSQRKEHPPRPRPRQTYL